MSQLFRAFSTPRSSDHTNVFFLVAGAFVCAGAVAACSPAKTPVDDRSSGEALTDAAAISTPRDARRPVSSSDVAAANGADAQVSGVGDVDVGPRAGADVSTGGGPDATPATGDARAAAQPGAEGLPPGWGSRDIDKSKVAGSTSYKDGTFTLKSSGREVWHWEDFYHYAYREVPAGKSEIVARVVSISDAGTGAERAGIMLRWDPDWTRFAAGDAKKSTGPGAMIWITRKGQVGFGLRTWQKPAPNGAAWHGWKPADYWRADGVGLPVWLKIERNGEQFQPYYSKNGTDWMQPKNSKGQPPMGQEDIQDADVQEMWGGVYAISGDQTDSGKMTTAIIESFKVTQ